MAQIQAADTSRAVHLPIRAKNLKEDGQNNSSNDFNNDINMTTADGGVKSFDNTCNR
jgi:hypothetical protein